MIYKKKNINFPQEVVLISSHVDYVDEISNPNFKITSKGNYKGTFDNAVTNAIAVIAMLEKRFADNVLIAFTGDEEEESARAEQVIEFLENKCCIGAFSLCIPTNVDSIKDMHSDKMLKVKKSSFDKYIEAVVQISNRMADTELYN